MKYNIYRHIKGKSVVQYQKVNYKPKAVNHREAVIVAKQYIHQ